MEDVKPSTDAAVEQLPSNSGASYRAFFGRLVPFREIAFTPEHKRLSLLDYDSDQQLIEQQCAFMEFYRDNAGRWARFQVESNGYVYALDSEEVVVVSPEWIRDRSPEFEMSR